MSVKDPTEYDKQFTLFPTLQTKTHYVFQLIFASFYY